MQKVISINLNGNAYQLDESGYEALREYLAGADRALAGNPDRAEIIADLEQAIADKCRKFLGSHKSVVSATEIDQIIKEMGPIDPGAGQEAAAGTADGSGRKQTSSSDPSTKRLYRNPDGAMIAGVCNGLASYFAIDVTIIRVVFVIVAILSKGAPILIYLGMMFIVPEAKTPEERAAAGGIPFNAKEVMDRAKRQLAEGKRHWRREWRAQQRQWRRAGWAPGMPTPYVYAQPAWFAPLAPILGLVHLALFVAMAATMISLVNTGGVLDWRLPEDVPLWAAVLILFVGYQVVVSPVRTAQQFWRPLDGAPSPWAFWNAVVWLIGMFVVVWLASHHVPEIREFLQRLPPLIHDFAQAMHDFWARHN